MVNFRCGRDEPAKIDYDRSDLAVKGAPGAPTVPDVVDPLHGFGPFGPILIGDRASNG